MMPLQVVYVNENKRTKKSVASFSFGSGTLAGHLLVSASSLVLIMHFWSIMVSRALLENVMLHFFF